MNDSLKMSKRPTPETDKNALLLANLDDWIDDCLRNSKPIGLTLCDARKRISDQSDRIAELWDAMEIIRRERDEARKEIEFLKKTPLQQRCQQLERDSDHWCDMHTIASKQRDEARMALEEIEDRCVDCEDACNDIMKIREIAAKALEGAK